MKKIIALTVSLLLFAAAASAYPIEITQDGLPACEIMSAPAELYDISADIDVSGSAGRDQARQIFTVLREKYASSGDVVLRICRPDSEIPAAATIAEWTSASSTIVWYENGAPAETEMWQPEISAPADDGCDYVINLNTEKFHYPDCSSVEDILEKNRKDFHGTRDEIIDMGYDPCGRCKP